MRIEEKNIKSQQFAAIIGTCLLIVILCLPYLQMKSSLFPDLKSEENRVLAKKPIPAGLTPRAIYRYLQEYKNYFDDNFGFRNALIKVNSLIHLRIFGITSAPLPSVVVGREGWLFYNARDDGSNFEDYYGLVPFSVDQLSAIKQNTMRLKRFLDVRGITLIFVIAPNKQTVYHEYLPFGVAMRKGRVTRVDQLSSILNEKDGGMSFIDMRAIFLKAKKETSYLLYFKTDTHWNDVGALLAYWEIMKRVKVRYPEIKIWTAKDFIVSQSPEKWSGDLSKMINARDYISDSVMVVTSRKPSNAKLTKSGYSQYKISLRSTIDGWKGPKIMVFGDSFAIRLIRFLADSFRDGVYLLSPPTVDLTIIDREKPNVLMVELTERYAGLLQMRWSDKENLPQGWDRQLRNHH